MTRAGKRYPLVLYTHMLDRWWPAVISLGLALFGLAWAIYDWGFEPWRWFTIANLGVVVLLFGMLLIVFRKSAYIQPCSGYLRLVTPFLRLNISYQRLKRTTSALVSALFPSKSLSFWKRDILEPLGGMTALVLDLNSYPIAPSLLRFFFSPFFFKDRTPHFVILVEDWMRLSSEMESLRIGRVDSPTGRHTSREASILSRLPHK